MQRNATVAQKWRLKRETALIAALLILSRVTCAQVISQSCVRRRVEETNFNILSFPGRGCMSFRMSVDCAVVSSSRQLKCSALIYTPQLVTDHAKPLADMPLSALSSAGETSRALPDSGRQWPGRVVCVDAVRHILTNIVPLSNCTIRAPTREVAFLGSCNAPLLPATLSGGRFLPFGTERHDSLAGRLFLV